MRTEGIQIETLESFSHVLIILMGSIGDVARGLCLVGQIKNSRPDCRVDWLVEPVSAPVVQSHSLIDRVFVFDRNNPLASIRYLAKALRSQKFDVVFDLQRHLKSGFMSWLSGGKVRIGFHRKNAKEFNWLFNNHHLDYYPDSLPKIEHYLKFPEMLGLKVREPFDFGLNELEPSAKTENVIKELGPKTVGLVLGSSWESKDWPVEGYKELISRLLEQEYQVLLLGDKSRRVEADSLSHIFPEAVENNRLLNQAGKTDLRDLIVLLRFLKVCIGPDSGPAHLAAGVNTPHVTLFGPTDPVRTVAFRSEHLAVQSSIGCAPCYRRKCPGLDKLCMRLLSVDMVMEKLAKAASEIKE